MKSKTYDISSELLLNACFEALEVLNFKYSIVNGKFIFADVPASIWSWGEEIEITIEELAMNQTKFSVESFLKSQIFDWGKNSKNESLIINTIDKILKNEVNAEKAM